MKDYFFFRVYEVKGISRRTLKVRKRTCVFYNSRLKVDVETVKVIVRCAGLHYYLRHLTSERGGVWCLPKWSPVKVCFPPGLHTITVTLRLSSVMVCSITLHNRSPFYFTRLLLKESLRHFSCSWVRRGV